MLRGVSAQHGESAPPPGQQTEAIRELFDRTGRLGRVDMLTDVTGSLRFDISEGEQVVDQWIVSLHNGQISVEHRGGDADGVVSLDRQLMAQMATGRSNAMSALLRGDMMVTGDVHLLVLLERLLPGPAGARGPRRTVMSRGAG
jgi:predicted lipid carrier protein YhbT